MKPSASNHGQSNNKTSLLTDNLILEKAILKTVAYFDLFDFPITIEALSQQLYQYHHPIHIKEIKGVIDHLVKKGQLNMVADHVILKGREAILNTRKERYLTSQKLWEKVNWYGRYLRGIPFIKMVAVCNNLAYNNASKTSDIDLFIVIQSGRMWLGRLLVTLVLQFFGVRRHGGKVAGRFCLSFFVTEKKLKMQRIALEPEDPYLAYWTQTLAPIYGEEMYKQFIQENESWLKERYSLSFNEKSTRHLFSTSKKNRWKEFWEWFLGGLLGKTVEGFLKLTLKRKTLSKKRSLGKHASVIVSDDMLKFHNHDRRAQFREKWMGKVANF